MFKVVSKHLFWWPVKVRLPDPEKAGEFAEHSFEIQFEAMPLDRAEAFDKAQRERSPEERRGHELDVLLEMGRNWRDVVDHAGAPVAFTAEVFLEQLQLQPIRDAVIAAYGEAINGQEPRRGN